MNERLSVYINAFMERLRRLSPAQLIALTFAAAIGVGTILLALPIAHNPGHSISLLNAFFTATSAICVTGLAVVDTGTTFSFFGRVILLLLIQVGGFGIITLGTLIALASGRRIGFKERMNLSAQLNALHVGGIVKLIKRILTLVVVAELLGALLLYIRFSLLLGPGQGTFYALFHSVSAFNNAGFAFYTDSLSSFATDPLVNLTIMALIVTGALGFIVVLDIAAFSRKRGWESLRLHSKMVLIATAFLIGMGTIVILIFEWSNPLTLGQFSVPGKVLVSMFQSVTPRTAGFNTVNYADMRGSTLVFSMLLMFIGGNPGSTAGGIKTVTFFVLIGSAWSISRGQGELILFKRRLALETVVKAGVIALFGMMISGAALTLLAMTEPHLDLFALAFEVISAISTVGISMGITAELTALGKVIVILLMYLGRLGPLTAALALMEDTSEPRITYPSEDIIIG